MEENPSINKIATELNHDINEALNRRIEERFRAALLLADPGIDMEKVTVVSNVENDNDLIVDGVPDETIDKALAIFEAQP